MKTIWMKHRGTVAACAAIALLYLLLFLLGITCPIKFLTGISCPGCGMTRAWLHALRFDLAGAFFYHPLWFLLPFLAVALIFCDRRGHKQACHAIVWVFVLLMLAVYVARLLTPQNVVVFAPQEGFVWQVATWLRDFFGATFFE